MSTSLISQWYSYHVEQEQVMVVSLTFLPLIGIGNTLVPNGKGGSPQCRAQSASVVHQ
jgi:hypothetical protein